MSNFDQWNEHKDIPTHVPTSEITKRISKDVTVNSFGRKLIAVCSNLNLFYTHDNNYYISSSYLLQILANYS